MPRPTVILQFKDRDGRWRDCSAEFFAVFEHERELAEERARDLNQDEMVRLFCTEYRVKPKS